MKDTGIIAVVDVGTSKTLSLIGRRVHGAVELLGAGVAPSHGVQKGVVVDGDAARESVRASISDARNASGVDVSSVHIAVSGAHIEAVTAWGALHSLRHNGAITEAVLARAMESATPERVSLRRQTLHKLPRNYYVDGLKGIRNPLGLHPIRLDVEALCITADAGIVNKTAQAVRGAHAQVVGAVASPVVGGEVCLTPAQRDQGVAVLDIGAGVTALTVYARGVIWNTATIPIGGNQFSSDLAWGANISQASAEQTKIRYGQATLDLSSDVVDDIPADDGVSAVALGPREVARFLHDRAVDLFGMVAAKLVDFGYPNLPAGGLVLTGGGSRLRGIDRIARQVFGSTIHVGVPEISGLPHDLRDPAFSAGLGALTWVAGQPAANEGGREEVRRRHFNSSYAETHAAPLERLKGRVEQDRRVERRRTDTTTGRSAR